MNGWEYNALIDFKEGHSVAFIAHLYHKHMEFIDDGSKVEDQSREIIESIIRDALVKK